MIAELGHFSLILALGLSVCLTVLPTFNLSFNVRSRFAKLLFNVAVRIAAIDPDHPFEASASGSPTPRK